jgi:hypothetical protein
MDKDVKLMILCMSDNAESLKLYIITYAPELLILQRCAGYGAVGCMRWFFEEYASIITKRDIINAITVAIYSCKETSVAFLLRYCNDVTINMLSNSGHTPLWYASKNRGGNARNICCMLIESGARTDTLNQAHTPSWLYAYESEIASRKQRCSDACTAVLLVFKKKGAPKDMTKWMVERFRNETRISEEWNN